MNKNRFRYILIVVFLVLFILQLVNYDYESGFQWMKALSVLTPLLMLVAMILSINHVKENGEN
jgi:NADH:ubiquinone oxidoreductase subunit 6 (subunit J)